MGTAQYFTYGGPSEDKRSHTAVELGWAFLLFLVLLAILGQCGAASYNAGQ